MGNFNDAIREFRRLADALKEIDRAIESVPESPDAPERIAEELGRDLGKELDPITPLAASREEALFEKEEKILSRIEKLGKIIEDKLED